MGKKWEGEGKEITGAEKVVILSLSSLRSYNGTSWTMQIQKQEKQRCKEEKKQAHKPDVNRVPKTCTGRKWDRLKSHKHEATLSPAIAIDRPSLFIATLFDF